MLEHLLELNLLNKLCLHKVFDIKMNCIFFNWNEEDVSKHKMKEKGSETTNFDSKRKNIYFDQATNNTNKIKFNDQIISR